MTYNDKYNYYDDDGALPKKPNLATTLDALKASEGGRLNSTIFYGLSDLSADDVAVLGGVWATLTPTTRRKVMRRVAETAETNFDLDYSQIGRLALNDSDAEVRQAAIETLAEDRGLDLMDRLIDMSANDDERDVRAVAMSGLGAFIYAGELGELPEFETSRAQDAAIGVLNDKTEPVEVRRRALEAISNCSIDMVPDLVREAYQNGDRRMRVSAVYAMGRTFDPSWRETVLRELSSEDPEMRFEAARSAGELEMRAAVPTLALLTRESDSEIREIAVWSLGEIGGEDAMKVLSKVARDAERAKNDDFLQLIEDAIQSASISSSDLLLN
ncbi:MAG: HEAT repeat domain-containing protein [Chloroflexota bacterium]|nr:HEAT repeat domain-containing protein [Chloroflexota bacterium]